MLHIMAMMMPKLTPIEVKSGHWLRARYDWMPAVVIKAAHTAVVTRSCTNRMPADGLLLAFGAQLAACR